MIYDFVTATMSSKGPAPAMQTARDQQRPTHPIASLGAAARSLEILQRLQTTLDVERIIELFMAEASTLVRIDGAAYRHDAAAISFRWQREERHSCAYRLTVEGEDLGELTFFRSKRFADQELRRLEQMLTALVYPLRNGLQYRQALQSARHDPLTGLYNRTALDEHLQREMQFARRHESPLSLMIIDLDHFKSVNDEHGHLVGDRVLEHLAAALNTCVRESDLLFRYGGEEFVVLLSNTDSGSAAVVAERVLACIRETSIDLGEDSPLRLTASVGVAGLGPNDDAGTLFERADQAMYKAKSAGRNRAAVL